MSRSHLVLRDKTVSYDVPEQHAVMALWLFTAVTIMDRVFKTTLVLAGSGGVVLAGKATFTALGLHLP